MLLNRRIQILTIVLQSLGNKIHDLQIRKLVLFLLSLYYTSTGLLSYKGLEQKHLLQLTSGKYNKFTTHSLFHQKTFYYFIRKLSIIISC